MRPKRGKSVKQRLEEMFRLPVSQLTNLYKYNYFTKSTVQLCFYTSYHTLTKKVNLLRYLNYYRS
uniref:Uncharacterized protein n=1 Tax=Papilio polytes TaxID=76194 RepID=I4DSE6_PAPPL|nr:unknown unsecreted protein [Papilio polytes]